MPVMKNKKMIQYEGKTNDYRTTEKNDIRTKTKIDPRIISKNDLRTKLKNIYSRTKAHS